VLCIRIVEVEITVLDVLGDAIDLELRVVDVDVGVGDCDHVDLSLLGFLAEERALAYADADAHLGAADVVKCRLDLRTLLIDQHVEIDVDVAPHCFVYGIAI